MNLLELESYCKSTENILPLKNRINKQLTSGWNESEFEFRSLFILIRIGF